MRIICISDLHSSRDRLEQIVKREARPDVLVLAGDITDFGTPMEAEVIVEQARECADHLVAVAGNCDSRDIDRTLETQGISVHARGMQIGETGFFGVSAMPPWTGTMYELTEEEIAEGLRTAHTDVSSCSPLIMVSHTPPRGSGVDRVRSGADVGSTAVRACIDEVQPDLVLSGHIHEARGQARLGRSIVVNSGLGRDGFYALVEVGAGEPKVELKRV